MKKINLNIYLGNFIIFLIALTTVLIWFFVRAGTPMFANYKNATHSLGQLTGLVGMTLFSLTFILTTRLNFIENLFGGLDKAYKTHHMIGAIAFILLLFHPLLIVIKFIPSNIKQAAKYLLPSGNWGINFGIIALLSMAFLIILTLYVNMKYQNWKISHKFMGAAYFFALLHVFMVYTDITLYPLLKNYMIFICTVGGISYLYSSFIGPKIRKKYLYVVEKAETRDKIRILELRPIGEKIKTSPGQFVFLRFLKEKISREQHPFTIASFSENKIKFAIKNIGDFTSTMNNVKPGVKVELEGPYGKFNFDKEKEKQIWIAGGIGITPFLSMLEYMVSKKISKKIYLYYCTKNKKEAVFLSELKEIEKKLSNLKIFFWYSEKKGHFSIEKIEKNINLEDYDFYICGPPAMMHSVISELRKKRISEDKIHFEEFNLK